VRSAQLSQELVASGDAAAEATAAVLHLPQRLGDLVAYCEVLEGKWLDVLANAGWSRSITGLSREGVGCGYGGDASAGGYHGGAEPPAASEVGIGARRPFEGGEAAGMFHLSNRELTEAASWRQKKAELLERSGCVAADAEAVWAVLLEPVWGDVGPRNGRCMEEGGEESCGGAATAVPGSGTGRSPDLEGIVVSVQQRSRPRRPRSEDQSVVPWHKRCVVSPTPLQVHLAETLCRQHSAATAAVVMHRAESASADAAAAAAAAAAAVVRRQLADAESAAATAAAAAGAAAERRAAAAALCKELQQDAMALQVGRPAGVYEAHLQESGLAGVWQCLVGAAHGAEAVRSPRHSGEKW
jgi:hypothetical protein